MILDRMKTTGVLLGIGLIQSAAAETPAPPIQPNIVHVMIDDLGWQNVACYYRASPRKEPSS